MVRKEALIYGLGGALTILLTIGCSSLTPHPTPGSYQENSTGRSPGPPQASGSLENPPLKNTAELVAVEQPGPPILTRDQLLLAKAQAKVKAGEFENALAVFDEAILENPKLLEAYLGAGQIHQKLGNPQEAEVRFEQATRLAPTSFEAHYYLARMRELLEKFELAIRAYLYALAINPEDFKANHHLANCYLQLGRPAQAVVYARTATEIDPDSQDAWANLGTSYSLMKLYNKAIGAYRQANELGDPEESILLGLAEAHNRLDHYDRAMAVLRTVLKIAPSALAYERMGYALFKNRQQDKALKQFRAALLFDPNDTAALNGIGVCMMTQYIQSDRRIIRHQNMAMNAWQRSIEINPNQPRITSLIKQFGRL